ncbi:monovalent cation/H+ antiporter subunit D family protein [Halovenus sp. WSH3]|uniref:Monovalent cation/H+ antiporter subunit D family protein n=1 Tax=Halovenus carboxidivorans TaxID=2692199 RepID=A0A6B0T809_9EURY|nr:proton-conducting transporter membrane subunit [Halovenus carboxidivorans]MXR53077.1 monovalent cation/H+ antiporter subunit D family protein [Halovenus carboxidivorans]
MSDLLLGLLIVLPLLGSTLSLGLGLVRERVGWWVATLVLAVEAGLASWVAYVIYVGGDRLVHVLGGETFGRKSITVGGETTNFTVGIELVGDALSGLVVVLVAGVALAALAYMRRAGPRGNAFYTVYLIMTGGLMGVALTGDLFNLFVFLEIVGLATYALIAAGRGPEAAVASLKYLVVGTTGASMYLIGVGYVFLETGALNMVDVSRSLAGDAPWFDGALYSEPLVVAAFGFVAVGLATKSAIFPLHTWQPGAYAEAPDAVTVYISALASTSAAYAFARITWLVFTPEFFAVNRRLLEVVLLLAGASVVAGSVIAAMQQRLKRTFAYSSVAQFGLVFLGICVAVHPAATEEATKFAVYGTVIHLIGHAVIKGGLFATAGALAAGEGARTLSEIAGLARRRPFISGSLTVLGLSLVGVPPSVGFVGKWYIGVGAVGANLWPVVVVIFASTVLSLLYIAQILEKLYFTPEATEVDLQDVEPIAADGGRSLSYGMAGVGVTAAVVAVALGFGGAQLASLLDPVWRAVVDSAPEVIA